MDLLIICTHKTNTCSLSICNDSVIVILYGRFSLEESKIYLKKMKTYTHS